MTNLEELSVDDTKVSLSHFPKIFEACQSLVKLSFTMNEKSLNEEQLEKTSLDLLKCGFAKLTYLKIFNFTTDEEATSRYETMDVEHPFESWLRILQVLKYLVSFIIISSKNIFFLIGKIFLKVVPRLHRFSHTSRLSASYES